MSVTDDVATEVVGTYQLLDQVAAVFKHHSAGQDRVLERDPADVGFALKTDSRLLARILVNMVKNALEAVPPGGKVRFGAEIRDSAPTFFVWNEGNIPRDVRLQIFQRSHLCEPTMIS